MYPVRRRTVLICLSTAICIYFLLLLLKWDGFNSLISKKKRPSPISNIINNLSSTPHMSTTLAREIPTIIHQLWKTNDTSSYPSYCSYHHWLIHPVYCPGTNNKSDIAWRVKLWTDREVQKLLEDFYPELLPIYRSYRQDIQRADIAR